MRQGWPERVTAAAQALRRAEAPVRVLRSIAWSAQVRERFFASKGRELPVVQYDPFDAGPVLEQVRDVTRTLETTPAERWLSRVADSIVRGALLLSTLGTREFFAHSRSLYGAPRDAFLDGVKLPLDLARRLDAALDQPVHHSLAQEEVPSRSAEEVADYLRAESQRVFREQTPIVEVVDDMAAKVVAGAMRIRVSRHALFSERECQQLVQHELLVHVATSLNGGRQTALPLLAASHPGTTRTQEGLAVFAELITGCMDPRRFRRLADRVLAIDMAINGADFLQVYDFFLSRAERSSQAYEDARRVFRGGVLSGGAPFTKDVVYLGGLIRVHNFLRAVIAADRADCLRLLFAGKVDIEDVGALCQLAEAGLCGFPELVPHWIADQRFLMSYLAYFDFIGDVDFAAVQARYSKMLADAPRVPANGGISAE